MSLTFICFCTPLSRRLSHVAHCCRIVVERRFICRIAVLSALTCCASLSLFDSHCTIHQGVGVVSHRILPPMASSLLIVVSFRGGLMSRRVALHRGAVVARRVASRRVSCVVVSRGRGVLRRGVALSSYRCAVSCRFLLSMPRILNA